MIFLHPKSFTMSKIKALTSLSSSLNLFATVPTNSEMAKGSDVVYGRCTIFQWSCLFNNCISCLMGRWSIKISLNVTYEIPELYPPLKPLQSGLNSFSKSGYVSFLHFPVQIKVKAENGFFFLPPKSVQIRLITSRIRHKWQKISRAYLIGNINNVKLY